MKYTNNKLMATGPQGGSSNAILYQINIIGVSGADPHQFLPI